MSKNKSFVNGQTVKISAEFRVDGTLTDPSAVTLTVQDPSGNDSTPSVSDDGTGLRSATVTLDETGYWKYKWASTGAAAGVQEGTFYCVGSRLA